MKIAVIGLGYVGLPLARLFATKYSVVGFDINQSRVDELNSGIDSTLEIEQSLLESVLLKKPTNDAIGLLCSTNLEDIKDCAVIAARMFDHIIIRQEKHLRGRTEEEIINLIIDGIKSVDKAVTYEIIPKETDAIKHAINIAKDGTFITALSDVITNAIEVVQQHLDKEVEEEV